MNYAQGVRELQRATHQATGRLEEKRAALRRATAELRRIDMERVVVQEAADILSAVAEIQREAVAKRVEAVCTTALRLVFQRPYTFRFAWEEKRGQVTATPLLKTEHGETDIVSSHGGGLVDVLSFVLRLVIAQQVRPPLARVLILDEPFKHLSVEHIPMVGELLRELHRRTGWRFLLCTHQEALMPYVDVAYRVSLDDAGVSQLVPA